MPIARADSWKRLPAPPARRLPFDAVYDADQYARLRQGLIPQEMEDKWFIYLEDGQLCLHRSWTGTWIYALRLEPEGASWRAAAPGSTATLTNTAAPTWTWTASSWRG